jgi:hypothetical protein
MNRYYKIILAVCIFGLLSVLIWTKQTPSLPQKLGCADIEAGCGNDIFKLKFMSSPAVMKPMRLYLETKNAKQVYVAFAMEKMDMGLNRYRLIKQGDLDLWLGDFTLPVCVQGRSDWIVEVEIKTQLETMYYQIPFKVDTKN